MPSTLARLERNAGRWLGGRFLTGILAVAVAQGALAAVVIASPWTYGYVGADVVFLDVRIYHRYADRIFRGEVPYRDFLLEYPPLALPLFLAPRLFASSFPAYVALWVAQMFAANTVGLWLAARWTAARGGVGRVPRCLAWYSAFFLACSPIALARFDLAAMSCAFAAATEWTLGHPVLGGALGSAAVLMKVTPGAATAPMFLKEVTAPRSSGLRGVWTSALVLAAGVAGWYALGRGGMADTFRYHSERGLEIGSLYTGVLELTYRVRGIPLTLVNNYGSKHLDHPLASRVASLSPYAQLAGVLVALFAYRRAGMRDALRCSSACLAAVIVFGKVLSPQYLIWLIPFVACLEGRAGDRARWTFLACLVFTFLTFPKMFHHLEAMTPTGIALLNSRNFLLLVLFGLLAFDRDRETA